MEVYWWLGCVNTQWDVFVEDTDSLSNILREGLVDQLIS